MPVPGPLFADFTPGFRFELTGVSQWNAPIRFPSFDAGGNLGYLPLNNNGWDTSANPQANYPGGATESIDGSLTNFQLKMAILSMCWQSYRLKFAPEIQRSPGNIADGGRSGTWLTAR